MGWLVISDCTFTCAEERDGETRLAGRIGGKFTKPPGSPRKPQEIVWKTISKKSKSHGQLWRRKKWTVPYFCGWFRFSTRQHLKWMSKRCRQHGFQKYMVNGAKLGSPSYRNPWPDRWHIQTIRIFPWRFPLGKIPSPSPKKCAIFRTSQFWLVGRRLARNSKSPEHPIFSRWFPVEPGTVYGALR